GKIGESYRVEEKQIDGYKLKETIGYIEGLYSKEPVEVIFVYSKEIVASEGEVVIHYKDTEGNEIAENDVIKGKIGAAYNIEAKQIENYHFKFVVGDTQSTFKEYKEEITFIYEALGTVTVRMGNVPAIGLNYTLYAVDSPYSSDLFVLDNILFRDKDAVKGEIIEIFTGAVGTRIPIDSSYDYDNYNNYINGLYDELEMHLTRVSNGEKIVLTGADLRKTLWSSLTTVEYYAKGNQYLDFFLYFPK
ncbi:hypothetical protein CI088_01660, partial [Enterococcus plantarum]